MYGQKMAIKYNPIKTSLMIFDNSCERSLIDKRADQWRGELKLENETIHQVKAISRS